MSEKFKIGLTASDVEDVFLNDLTDEQLAVFDIGRDGDGRYYVLSPSNLLYDEVDITNGSRVYFSSFSSKAFKIFNSEHTDVYGNALFTVEKDNAVSLSSLSDADLEMLGVPETGDVMIFNGKVCFRYYIAELESYFDVDSRHISIDLLN
ncbi:MAG: hypothetical protein IJM55_01410 [Ruminococcus sp.]|nr:hypothetical protein [Ruminococcus sp.]